MQDRLGENLIAGILAEKKLPNCSIKDTDLNFAARKAFSYIRDYLEKYNQWPLPEDVAEESGITLPVHYPPVEASAEKIRKRALAGAVEKTTKSVIAALNDNDPDRALDYIRKLDENSSKVRAAPYDYTISGADRMEYYLSLQETGGLRGLESPWETINRAAAGFVKGEFIVFAAYYGIGKCQAGTNNIVNPVTGSWGTVQQAYEENWPITSVDTDGNLHLREPLKWISTGTKKGYKVTTKTGYSAVFSEDHKLLTPNGWRPLKEFEEGDFLASCGKTNFPLNPESADPNECVIVACLIADGSLTRRNEIGFTKADETTVDLLRRSLRAVGSDLYQRPSDDTGFQYFVRDCHLVWDILDRWAVPEGLSKDKVLPDKVFRLDEDSLKHFIGALWACGGSVDRRGSLTYCSASRELCCQLREILLRWGIVCSQRDRTLKGGYHASEIRVYAERANKFREVLSLPSIKDSRIRDNWGALPNTPHPVYGKGTIKAQRRTGISSDPYVMSDNLFWDTVVKIESVGEVEMFDCQVPEDHNYLIAGLPVHNSWMCCMLSDWFLNQGAKVLLVTMEMPTNKIARRVDAVRHRIPFSALRRSFAGCDPVAIDLWKERMASDRDTENRLLIADKKIVESARDVMDLAREFKPDAVLIDGGYRLHGAGSGRWESMARTIEDLQLFAEATDIPWIVTTQLGNAGDSGKESVKAGKIKAKVRYGQEWLIDPDLVIIMSQTEVQRELSHMELHIHKVREGVADETTPFIVVNWDLDEMKFSEISPESEEEESNELVF